MFGLVKELGVVVKQAIRYQRIASDFESNPGEMRDALMLAIAGMSTPIGESAERQAHGRITPLYASGEELDRKVA